jgi:N-acetylglucosaminyl-diphospho-decaprenol L-rhamnosyltransferase
MNLSVIIATHNSLQFIGRCLESINANCELTPEFVVIDNASSDGTRQYLGDKFPEVRLIANNCNLGHCAAVNQGLVLATRDYVMVLDADTFIQNGVLEQLLHFLQQHSDVAVVAPKILNGDGTLQRSARNFPRPVNGLFGRQSLLTRWFPGNPISRRYLGEETISPRKGAFAVEFVSSACMMFPRRLAQQIGPWDEEFGGYWVDGDWCKRARTIGLVYCLPQVSVIHYEQNRRGVRKGSQRIRAFHQGAYIFYRKHFTLGYLDPRALAAAVLLSIRAGLLIAIDRFLPLPASPTIEPVSHSTTLHFAEKGK